MDFRSISQSMPPRRELPFAKPASRPTSKSGNQRAKVQGQANGPENALGTANEGANKQPARKAPKSRKVSKEMDRVPTVEELLKMSPPPPAVPMGRSYSWIHTSSSPAFPPKQSTTVAEEHSRELDQRPVPTNIDSTGARQLTGHRPLLEDSDFSVRETNPTSRTRMTADEAQAARLVRPGNTRLDAWGDPEGDMDAFVAKSPTERQGEIEDWICRQLMDPNFKTLCEDVETCWRRVFLGE
jgi:hypothetical protein